VIASICWFVIALSNAVAGYSLWRFTREAIPQLRRIREGTDVVKYHILRQVHDKRKAEIEAQLGGEASNKG